MAFTATYNTARVTPQYIFRATTGGTVFSANLVGSAVFDYFTDTAVANDAIYFSGNSYVGFSNLYLNVGTALAGTNVVVVREYYSLNGPGWRTMHDITDGSNGFTTTGQVVVKFPLQAMCMYTSTVNATVNIQWIRCRIVSLTAISEGGANVTDIVKVSDGFLNISGTTDAVPATRLEVYNWLTANAPQTRPEKISFSAFKFNSVSINLNTTLRSTKEQIFIGNGATLSGFFGYYGLRSGTKVGTEGRADASNYFLCRRSGGGFAGGNASTRIYGGGFYFFTNTVDGISCVGTGYMPMSSGEYLGCYFQFSGYFQTAIINKCMVDGQLVSTPAPTIYPENLIIGNPLQFTRGLYSSGFTCKGINFGIPIASNFNWSNNGNELGIVINIVNPVIPLSSSQAASIKLLTRSASTTRSDITNCFFYDDSAATFTDYTAQAISVAADDVPIWGAVNDCLYIRTASRVAVNQQVLNFTITAQANNYVYVLEQWTGVAWATTNKEWNLTNNFQQSGRYYIAAKNGCPFSRAVNGVTGIRYRIRIVTPGAGTPMVSRIQQVSQLGIGDWKIYQKYTIQSKVLDTAGNPISGVNVAVKDVLLTTTNLTTAVTGLTTSTDFINQSGYLDPVNGDAVYNVAIQSYNPYTITFTKAGYETYVVSNFVLDKITNMTITLKPIEKYRFDTEQGKQYLAIHPEEGSSSDIVELG